MSDDPAAVPPTPPLEETALFRFHDGQRLQARDPYRVDRLLDKFLGGQPLDEAMDAARAPATPPGADPLPLGPLGHAALEKLLAAVQAAFEMPPVRGDGSGMTEKAHMRVLGEFLAWKEAVRSHPPFASSATSPPPTAGPSSAAR